MSDYGDFCRDMKEYRRQKKDQWRFGGGMQGEIEAAEAISESVIHYSEEHMRLTIKTDRGLKEFDFWPSTKRWKALKGKAYGFGIRKLASYLKIKVAT